MNNMRPILPFKKGYIEVVDSNGNHTYKKVENSTETRVETLETDNKLLTEQLKAASDQNEFLEDCIAEMAEIVYA